MWTVYTLGYVAKTATVYLTVPTMPAAVSVTSINGWILFHSRLTAAYQTNMNWNDYATGFGDPKSSDFWLGLEYVHQLTTSATYLLRIEIQSKDNGKYDKSVKTV